MESCSYTSAILNRLMLPSIFFSSMVAVMQSIFECDYYVNIILSSMSALIAFILAVINFLKLEGAAEAYKISSHQYDKLQTFAEFQSGNVLLFSNPTLTKDTAITQWEEYKRIVDVTCPFDEETERNKWISNEQSNKIKSNYDERQNAELSLVKQMREIINVVEKKHLHQI